MKTWKGSQEVESKPANDVEGAKFSRAAYREGPP